MWLYFDEIRPIILKAILVFRRVPVPAVREIATRHVANAVRASPVHICQTGGV